MKSVAGLTARCVARRGAVHLRWCPRCGFCTSLRKISQLIGYVHASVVKVLQSRLFSLPCVFDAGERRLSFLYVYLVRIMSLAIVCSQSLRSLYRSMFSTPNTAYQCDRPSICHISNENTLISTAKSTLVMSRSSFRICVFSPVVTFQ